MNESRPSISLAMIVKDEQFNLYTCLKQVEDIVDEIVIVDTGSTDGTLEVAGKFGASIYTHRWEDDFSGPRNLSLEKCNGDWILVLDADEFIDGLAKPAIRELIKTSDFIGFQFEQFTYLSMDFSPEYHSLQVTRLFPNNPSLRFVGTVRENLVSLDIEKQLGLVPTGIRIWHYGYMDVKHPAREKHARDLKIYLKNLDLHPEDPLENFFTGLQYLSLYKYEEALSYVERAIKYGSEETLYYPEFFSTCGGILVKLKRYSEAQVRCEEALSRNPHSAEAYFNLGEALKNLGEYDTAVFNLERAIQENKNHMFFQDNSKSSWKAYFEMGLCYIKKKYYKEGRDAFLKALNLKPLFSPLIMSLAYIYNELGDITNAEKYFFAAYEQEPNRMDLAYELYGIYKKTERNHLAASMLENIYYHNNEKVSLLLDLAKIFEKIGNNFKAIDYYSRYIEVFPSDSEACLRRGICFFKTGATRKARKDFERAREENPPLLKKIFLKELL